MRRILFKAIEYAGFLGAVLISIGLANLRPGMEETLWIMLGVNLALLVCWIGAAGYRKSVIGTYRNMLGIVSAELANGEPVKSVCNCINEFLAKTRKG